MDRGAWWGTQSIGSTRSQTQLSDSHFHPDILQHLSVQAASGGTSKGKRSGGSLPRGEGTAIFAEAQPFHLQEGAENEAPFHLGSLFTLR